MPKIILAKLMHPYPRGYYSVVQLDHVTFALPPIPAKMKEI